jgi:hypothetical protein
VTAIDAWPFEEVWAFDFEFVPHPGDHPDVVCLAAHELGSGRTISLWRDQLGPTPPYRIDDRVLFVSFVANAELTCHLSLGWLLPAKVIDLNPEFRRVVNGNSTPEGKGLLGALAFYGFDTIGVKRKDAMRDRIMRGWPFSVEERELILRYCAGDVNDLTRLLLKMMPEINLELALYRGEFVASSARMEHRGVPIDMHIFQRLRDPKTWVSVRDAMVPVIDANYGVYVQAKNGDWTFSAERFETYLERRGIDWPRLESGKLNLRRKTFENMTKGWPELEELRQLRHARDKMRSVKLAVGADGRNRTVLWPFKSKTSRTQPKAAEWIFSPAVWLRSLIKPGPGRAVAYIDYSAMEFLIAAVLSNDKIMLELYASGDPYFGFAKRVGAVPADATQQSHEAVRELYKNMLLAVQYGMSSETLAARLGVSSFEAHELLNQHLTLFAHYWRWSDDWVATALNAGIMRTVFDWTCRTGITEFNERSIRNWPIQAAGAEILRIACIMATRHGIELIAPVHDAVLIESSIDRIEADVALMEDIMRRASRVVLNARPDGPYELRTAHRIVRYPDRYMDKRGANIWARVLELLPAVNRETAR